MKKDSNIIIYDSVFSHSLRTKLYEKVINSDYHIGWADTKIIENSDKVFMYSEWDAEKYIKSGLLSEIKNKDLLSKIDNRLPVKCIVNCGTFGDVYIPHSHYNQDVLLYYANLDWKVEWNGETAFYSEDLKEVILTNPYVPGRVAWFNGEVPHSIKPQTHTGPKFRFTISLFFDKDAPKMMFGGMKVE